MTDLARSLVALLVAFSLAVAGSGYILTGGSGLQDFSRTAVSLVQLVVIVVPLTSLVIGVMALVSDHGACIRRWPSLNDRPRLYRTG